MSVASESQDQAFLSWGRISGFLSGVTLVAGVVDFLKPLGWSLVWLLVALVVALLLVALQPQFLFRRLTPRFWKPSHRRSSLAGIVLSILIVGFAYAKSDAAPSGLLASVSAPVADLQAELLGLARQTAEDSEIARENTEEILEEMKRETSDDPRKELQNRGVAWSQDAFMQAVEIGDLDTLRLFLQGGMPPQTAQSEGRRLPVMLSLNESNPSEVLDLLIEHGLDVDLVYRSSGGVSGQRQTLLSRAIDKGNVPLARALVRRQARLNDPIQTIGAMGAAVDTYPLAAAIQREQLEIANELLDAGADVAVGDYLAFRQASDKLERAGPDQKAGFEAIVRRTAPQGAAAVRIADEERLRAVESELVQVALESLRAPSGSAAKAQLDARYDDLQVERRALMKKLGMKDG